MPRSSTTSGTQNLRRSKKDVLVRGGCNDNKGRQGVYFALANLVDPNPDPRLEDYKHLKPDHGATLVDMQRAEEEKFFHQTLNCCVICFNTVPPECLTRVILLRNNDENNDPRYVWARTSVTKSGRHTVEQEQIGPSTSHSELQAKRP